ncbi:MAG: TRAP transporter large permease subunit, partial [Burkholderiaceae bacterium]|jgi:C4-dicarboxylate transporter DctM subunit|nr:TRAP transporter large permease subunit [Burkholderiaceae bacterium]
MEPSSILLITVPVLFPVAMKLGIDPIHFGIIMTVNMEIGMITPPVGLNLYVASGISNMGLTEVTKACAPWILVMIAFLGLITYVPEVTLWLPNLLMGD